MAARMPTTIRFCLSLMTGFTLYVAVPAQAAVATRDAGPFAAVAGEILDGLMAARLDRMPAISGYGAPRLAVWPFAKDGLPVSLDEAKDFNSRLVAELARQGRGRFEVVARDALNAVIGEIDRSGELEDKGWAEAEVADLLRNARVDVLVVGKLRQTARGVMLSYEAISMADGTLFAGTHPRPVPQVGPPARMTDRVSGPVYVQKVPAPPPPPPPVFERTPPDRVVLAPRGRPTVARVQAALWRLGYEPGTADGLLDQRLRHAIEAFQRDHGLRVDGRLTRTLARQVRDALEDRKEAQARP